MKYAVTCENEQMKLDRRDTSIVGIHPVLYTFVDFYYLVSCLQFSFFFLFFFFFIVACSAQSSKAASYELRMLNEWCLLGAFRTGFPAANEY